MASSKKEKQQKTAEESIMIPPKLQHIASVLIIFVSLVIFFNEIIFKPNIFGAADTISSKSFQTLVADAEKEGIFPLWNPYIFCGMPGYASLSVHGERYFDVTAYLLGKAQTLFGYIVNNPDIGWGLFYYFILGTGMYFFVYEKLRHKLAALIAGLAVMHSTFIVILIMVGHMTKVPVIAFFPWIFLILERQRITFDLPLFLALAMLLHFMILPSHIQMIFYVYFAFGIYYLFFLVRAMAKKEDWKGVIRSGVVLAAASVIAVGMSGDQYLSTMEYSSYSMRGSSPIVAAPGGEAAAGNEGLDYDYATNWSFSPGEIVSLFIPSSHGFGWHQYQGALTQNQAMRINTYFGPMPFTDAPQYMGVVITVFALIGLWKNRKDPFIQFCGLLTLLSLLISFGKEMPLIFDPMFTYFPMFNKFRIPSMILILVQIIVPVMAAYGIVSLTKVSDEREKKHWLYAAGAFGVLLILSLMAKDVVVSVYGMFFTPEEVAAKLSQSYGNNQMVLAEFYKIISGMVVTDTAMMSLLMTITLGGMYLYWKRSLRSNVLFVGLIAVVLFDLWRVNFKPMDPKPHHEISDSFDTPQFVRFLQQDTTQYRTLQFENGQPPYDNTLAYWRIQSAYGYHGAKMRQIQDAFDVVGLGNPLLWGLMNVKYIISNRPDSNEVLLPIFAGDKNVLYNRAALPRAFFVNRFEKADGLRILNNIKQMNFQPNDVAFGTEEIGQAIDPPQPGAEVRYTHFGMQDLELNVKATGNNLIFLSESWYPEGWKAYMDGAEIPIHRLNYMFRGVVVSAGEHTVTMKFEPRGFYVGRAISLVINILVIAGMAFIVVRMAREKKNTEAPQV